MSCSLQYRQISATASRVYDALAAEDMIAGEHDRVFASVPVADRAVVFVGVFIKEVRCNGWPRCCMATELSEWSKRLGQRLFAMDGMVCGNGPILQPFNGALSTWILEP